MTYRLGSTERCAPTQCTYTLCAVASWHHTLRVASMTGVPQRNLRQQSISIVPQGVAHALITATHQWMQTTHLRLTLVHVVARERETLRPSSNSWQCLVAVGEDLTKGTREGVLVHRFVSRTALAHPK